MNQAKLFLSCVEGEVAVVISKIIAYHESEDERFAVLLYVEGISEPIAILESFQHITTELRKANS